MKRALVLAGGVAGIAWELGVLRGLQDADSELAGRVLAADLVIGTSAGSAVAAQITSGVPLADLYDRQLSPESAEIEVQLDMEDLLARFTAAGAGASTPDDAMRAIGALALDTDTVAEPVRKAAIAARLPVPDWPDRPVLLPAIDALTGELTVFSRDSRVALVDAVAASCAVPGIWPPVTINGRRYIDGGVGSATHADLAAGYDRILVIVPGGAGPARAVRPAGRGDRAAQARPDPRDLRGRRDDRRLRDQPAVPGHPGARRAGRPGHRPGARGGGRHPLGVGPRRAARPEAP